MYRVYKTTEVACSVILHCSVFWLRVYPLKTLNDCLQYFVVENGRNFATGERTFIIIVREVNISGSVVQGEFYIKSGF